VRAADLGARVINISAVTCLPANKTIDQTELGAALRYAAVQKDAVIVAAAGNTHGGLATGSACEANPLTDPARPDDPRNWAGVTSVSIPSWWQPYVLSVGSTTANGQPSDFTMAGPWLGIAAPGEHVVSLSNGTGGGLANGLPNDQQEMFPISGTSYAAAYVSGVAALVRSKFPDLTAAQVIHRLTATARGAARSPSNLVGAGSVDAVAALTWHVPVTQAPKPEAVRPVAAPPAPPVEDTTPRTVAFLGTAVLTVMVLAAIAIRAYRRKDST
jgi:membrane-anchored mycosin MYCP